MVASSFLVFFEKHARHRREVRAAIMVGGCNLHAGSAVMGVGHPQNILAFGRLLTYVNVEQSVCATSEITAYLSTDSGGQKIPP